jgi:non-haem Fe2+, alpha-ketoglutarate-dependent halogenase
VNTQITARMAQQFEQEGILFPFPVLSPEEVAFYRAALFELGERLKCAVDRLPSLHEYFAWAYDLSVHPRVVSAVQEVLGAELVHWGTLVFSKPPRSSFYASWHQDAEYATFLNGAPSISAWIAFSDSTVASGCMRVLPGSHNTRVEHVQRRASENLLKMGQTVALDVPEDQAVNVELKAGEMSLHHVDVIHGSGANSSGHDRTGFIIRFTTPEILPGTRVVKAAGSSTRSHLNLIPRPVDTAPPEVWRAYRELLRSQERSRRMEEK